MECKIKFWYRDDENLSGDYKTVLKDLKKIVEVEKKLDSKTNSRKVNFFFFFDITEKQKSTNLASSKKIGPGIETPTNDELIITTRPEIADRLMRK